MSREINDGNHFTVFYSYASVDEKLCDILENHLSTLKRQGYIESWSDRCILPGQHQQRTIDEKLLSAEIILLLISADFIASDYRYGVEMEQALTRHRDGEAYVIPILLRPVDIQGAPFADLQTLPRDGCPITAWENRDSAFNDVATGIRIVVEHLQDALGERPLPPLADWPPARQMKNPALTPVSRRERERFLKRLRGEWITQRLHLPFARTTRIPLMLREQPDTLENPRAQEIQESKRPAQLLPLGTRMIRLYDQADGDLLILGEPGAGKTLQLLEVVNELLYRAEYDEGHWIPVVCNLASWTNKHQSLADWLVEELHHDKNGIRQKTAIDWVENEYILPLLDELDAIPQDQRQACVQAINKYKQQHPLVPIMVTSRLAEYLALDTHLLLRTAIVIEPLSTQQTEAYFRHVEEKMRVAEVHAAIQKEVALQELVRTPLMLDIVTIAYENASPEQIQSLVTHDLASIQSHVFDVYVEKMLIRRKEEQAYKEQKLQIKYWLHWLAKQMKASQQTELYLELMQPSWLPESQQRQLDLIAILIFKGIVVVGAGIEGYRSFGILGGLGYAVAGGLLARAELVKGAIVPAEVIRWPGQREHISNVRFRSSLGAGLTVGLGVMLLIFVLSFLSVLLFLIRGSGPVFGANIPLSFVFTAGLSLMVGSATLFLLQSGWSSQLFVERHRLLPNEGIWRSGRNSLITGLIFGLLSDLIFTVTLSPIDGVICGVTIGLVISLFNGGMACIKHVILRTQLAGTGSIPWKYQRFLDYATDRILLYKRGNGYTFYHDLLMDYFVNYQPAVKGSTKEEAD